MIPAVRRSLQAPAVRSLHVSAPRRGIARSLWCSRFVRYPVYAAGSLTASVAALLGGILAYDAMTYDMHVHNHIPSLESSLVGGPEKLPIFNTGSQEGPKPKERLVVVGGGWAAVALLDKLDRDAYDVVLVSPNNFFLFTPLLPSAAVGTVEPRSIIESLRRLLSTVSGSYIQGAACGLVQAHELDSKTQHHTNANGLVEVEVISDDTWDGDRPRKASKNSRIYVPYDKLVIAVGSVTNSHGIKGLDHCYRLKTIQDARDLRKHLMDNLEIASLPTKSEEERRRLLSVVICGGGPTGVEVAAEIFDMVQEDVERFFPEALRKLSSVHLLQGDHHVLNSYSEAISLFAEQKFRRAGIDLHTNAMVNEVLPESVRFTKLNPDTGVKEDHLMPSGCTVWSAGITMSDFSRRLSQTLPNQGHHHALKVDEHLRVLGTPPGTVYAVGDASTIDYDIEGELDRKLAQNPGHDLGYADAALLVNSLRRKFPIAAAHLSEMRRLFREYDYDSNHRLSHTELRDLVLQSTKNMTSLPPTAQVASQEGKYLGRKLNKYAKRRDAESLPTSGDVDDDVYRPFSFRGLGSVAYLGNAAAFDLPLPGPLGTVFGGIGAMYAWRSVYLSELVSMRTRLLVLSDYIKRGLWGRDLSRI